MNLVRALRTELVNNLAFVGAGGKTTAMFRLARELETSKGNPSEAVFVTTTTHLAVDQLGLADSHYVLQSEKDLELIKKAPPKGVVLFTGRRLGGERVDGPQGNLVDHLGKIARTHQVPLLVEADGSRRRPVKAPADHEPEVPDWVEMVVVVAGLSALNQTLESKWVHRPEIFSRLSGLAIGDRITIRAIEKMLLNPDGGLKNIPPAARSAVLFNQAGLPASQGAAARVSSQLLEKFDAVLVCDLKQMHDHQVGFEDFSQEPVFAVHEKAAAILLAAGESSRFGEPKQLLDWHGEPMVRAVARTAVQAGLHQVIVVTGSHAAEVDSALAGLPVQIVHNDDWEAGQGSSVRTGVSHLGDGIGSVTFLLTDQPLVSETILRSLVEQHALMLAPIIAPQVGGQRGNPVLFDRTTFKDLSALRGDMGGRALFSKFPVTWLPWHDHSLLMDVDTPEDYEKLLSSWGR